jgi:cyclophilin family peptidyl-prolyl cis-trans isomerase
MAEYQGPRRTKLPFPINILFNQKFFYVTFIVVMIASMAAVGLSPGGSKSKAPNTNQDVTAPEATPSGVKTFSKADAVVDASIPHVATLQTNKGTIKIDLLSDAPEAVNSFAFLAGSGFYNGTTFFYVNKDYFAQAGDPTCSIQADSVCTGSAGPGYTLDVENKTATHDQWTVVAPYVTQGQSVHGSQFRVLFQKDSRLDGQETVFGKITDQASRDLLSSLSTFEPCSVVSSPTCTPNADMSSALVIQTVTVGPANV